MYMFYISGCIELVAIFSRSSYWKVNKAINQTTIR